MRREYAQFEEDVQKVCGEFLNVSKLLEEEQKREANLRNMVIFIAYFAGQYVITFYYMFFYTSSKGSRFLSFK